VTGLAALAALLLLLIPEPKPAPPHTARGTPFAWHQDERWEALEASFLRARAAGCESLAPRIEAMLHDGRRLLAAAASCPLEPRSVEWDDLQRTTFELGPMIAACPGRIPDYIDLVTRMRSLVKTKSRRWDMAQPATRDRLYRMLYAGRAAA